MFTALKKLKNKKRAGLMLYEMIISVFIISISSVFILQLFLYSKTLNAKANDIDNSIVVILNAMELSKNYPTLNKYFKDDFFDGAILNTSDTNKQSNIYKYYDENWNTIYSPANIDKAKYILELNVAKIESSSNNAILTFKQDALFATTYGSSTGLKYNIHGKVYYAVDPSNILISLQTTSYFSNNIK